VVDKEWELDGNGRLSCRFTRQMKVDSDDNDNRVDLNNIWYQLYAWGAVSSCQSPLFATTIIIIRPHAVLYVG